MRYLLWLPVVLAVVSPAMAQAPAPIKIVDEFVLTWSKTQTFPVVIPTVPEGYRALVHFLGRLQAPTLSGSTHMLQMRFNGTVLDRRHLADKSDELQAASGSAMHWFGAHSLRLLYSPDFVQGDGPGDSTYNIVTGKAYEFELDVTDLVKPGDNTLAATHIWGSQINDIILKDLAIVFRQPDELYAAPGQTPQAPTGPLPRIEPREVVPATFTATLGEGGGITLQTAAGTFRVDSDFTYPNAGHNLMPGGTGKPTGADDWQVRGRSATSTEGNCHYYTVSRQITPRAECLDVADTITNRTGQDLGIIIQHTVALDAGRVREYRLGGLRPTLTAMRRSASANASTFASLGASGLGLLPRDDVFRVHATNFYEPGKIGLQESMFALPAQGSYTLRWSVFPVPAGGYYDFINAARRTLGVNFALDGPMAFAHYARWIEKVTVEQAKPWAENRSLRYVSNEIARFPGRGYAHGSAMLLAEVLPNLTLMRNINATIKQAWPTAQSLLYYHCYLSTEPGAAQKYADAIARDPDGKQYDYHDPQYPEFVPTLENSYGQAMQKVLDLILDELKFDGVYWDEMDWSRAEFIYDWPQWDGHTAQIDPQTFTIARKMCAVPLISQPFREAMVKRILGGGHPLVANGAPTTETMMRYQFPRFVETGGRTAMYDAQLFTPLGLADALTEQTQQDVADHIRDHLDYGCTYYFDFFDIELEYPMLTRYMFPLTPVELHEGYILARERILTNRAGVFGWGDRCGHEVHVFDHTGRETTFAARTFTEGGATWTELRLPRGYVAAVVRK